MIYEVYTRIMVGLPLAPGVLGDVVAGLNRAHGLEPGATVEEVYATLRADAPRHKLNEPDRDRYELALEAHVDGLWEVDCALSGVSDGLADPVKCQLWVGVRIEQMVHSARVDVPVAYTRPRVLRKGDLSMGSDFSKELGPDMYKEFRHAAQMFQRARLQIDGDAFLRTKKLPTSRQHEAAWTLVRWLVPVKS